MTFKPNRKFKRHYDRIYQKSPEAANMFLLLAELADSNGRIATNDDELVDLFNARFEDPRVYSL